METGSSSGSDNLRPQGLPRGEESIPARPMGRLPANRPERRTKQDFAKQSATSKPYQLKPAGSSALNRPQSPTPRGATRAHESSGGSESVESQQFHQHQNRQAPSSSLGGLYFLLATMALMCGVWIIGPRLVQEYHYAATVGKLRGEYDNAVVQLEKQPLHNVSRAYQLVAQKIRPSVVSINAIKARFEEAGLGSGVIMSEDGYIMTNAHVLENATRFFVELHDRRRFEAYLVGTDSISDLAVLKIEAPKLIPAAWGESDDVDVGSIVWAIGSPYGFQQTVTSGILSGKDRPGDPNHKKQSLLQTDAAVNPGNSGGPLVDAQGRVIGINTSIFGETFQGISFAVPSATARFVFQQLIENNKVTRGYLGVLPSEVDYDDAVRLQLPDLDGAKLATVASGSPAFQAGIRPYDIIRTWDGIQIKEFRDLFRLAETTPPNTTVEITLLRGGKEHRTNVTVGTLPEARVLVPAYSSRGLGGGN